MDLFDILAFVVFTVLIAAGFSIIVGLGMLPGLIARRRHHPQAAAINVASWLGIATLGVLWPFALIWAFVKPSVAAAETANAETQARMADLETALHELRAGKEVVP